MGSRTGIRLPQSIIERIDSEKDESTRSRGKPGRPKVSRKEARKQERADKKHRKASFFSSNSRLSKRQADFDHPESPSRKRTKLDPPERPQSAILSRKPDIPRSSAKAVSILWGENTENGKTARPRKSKSALEQLSSRYAAPTIPRTQQEEVEDKYIAHLEGLLGSGSNFKKGGLSSKEFDEDGLGDLLQDLDSIGRPSKAPQFDAQPSEFEAADDSDPGGLTDETGQDVGSEEEWSGIGGPGEDNSGMAEPDKSSTAHAGPAALAAPAVRYVPPHLRDKGPSDEDSEKLAKLSRQLKGLLNRLSEQNIVGILSDVEELYRQNRRHDVTSLIASLIIDGISAHSILLDSYVVLHAAFISSLQKIIGIEFAAYFVQNVVSAYERHYSSLGTEEGVTPREDETRGKECSNLIVLLSELYNFQVISCILIYDVIRCLLDKELTEFTVELLLKLLRNSGQQLRQDDPSALKDVVQIVQNKTSGSQEASSSRTQFMIETLINLKNNKVKRSATQHAGGDAVERMKKFLSGLAKKRHVASNEPLRVSLADLHSAESKGKWWLVGAAWGGDPLVDRQATANRPAAPSADHAVENALLKLAKKQGMNTDVRRNIFVVLMSSDDFVDACERLAQLSLTEIQQREVVRVILHCCGNEKTYNPYYAFVCQRLCQTSHSYKVTLQFCLWDFLRDLGETNVGGAEIIKSLKDDDGGFNVKTVSPTRMRNVAKAYAWWVAKDCVTLAIYKPVDFTSLKPQTQKFMTEFHRHLFLNSQSSAPVLSSDTKDLPLTRKKSALEEIFIKATRIETLAAGLAYFLSRAFKLTDAEDPENAFMAWASGVAVETVRTGVDIVSTL